MSYLKFIVKLSILIFILLVSFTILSNVWIISSTKDQVYSELDLLPKRKVTLVLGTSKKVIGGEPNPFFENRMDAAAKLYSQGKTKHFLLSGDNREKYYNEPNDMRKALIARGVPEDAITLDYAGLRTFDSIIRAKEIFSQESLIIVTQEFHAYRALFISDYYGIDAVAYTAGQIPVYESTRVNLREFLARPKAIIDLYLIKNSPAIMGEKEKLKTSI